MKKLTATLGVLLLGMIVGCLGGGSKKSCDAHLSYKGKEFDAKGDGEAFAKESACIGYCSEADATVDEAYKAWKVTPDGEKSTMSRFAEMDIIDELRPIKDACVKTCNTDVASGAAEVKVTCP